MTVRVRPILIKGNKADMRSLDQKLTSAGYEVFQAPSFDAAHDLGKSFSEYQLEAPPLYIFPEKSWRDLKSAEKERFPTASVILYTNADPAQCRNGPIVVKYNNLLEQILRQAD